MWWVGWVRMMVVDRFVYKVINTLVDKVKVINM